MADTGQTLDCGQVVDLEDHDGNWVARGLINPSSRLRVRLYLFDRSQNLNAELIHRRIDQAIARRRLAGSGIGDETETDDGDATDNDGAERLVFSESDLLSGLIVDRYSDCLGIQFTAGALMTFRDSILEHLAQALSPRQMVVRVDERTSKLEGIEFEEATIYDVDESGVREHASEGESGSVTVPYRQNGLDLIVDLAGGQKTGGYLDQRVNHAITAGYCQGKRVLDVCCYTGGFGLAAAKAGATSVLGVDSSQMALDAAAMAAQRNGISNTTFLKSDCFDALKRFAEERKRFDVVVLDPPRFAGSRHQIDAAIRAYCRLNCMAVDLLPPGGILVTCSCSGRVKRADFLNMLLDVGRRRQRDIVVLENRGPAPDHPVSAACPESDYLKCFICQVT